MQRIESVARRVADGDFTARFPTGDDDELGNLARALDDMQTQLAELDSARKQFIATASHELRTPIFSLGGYVELLQDEDRVAETRVRFLARIRDRVARLGRLTTDLLDLPPGGRLLELREEEVDRGRSSRWSAPSSRWPSRAANPTEVQSHRARSRLCAILSAWDRFCDPHRQRPGAHPRRHGRRRVRGAPRRARGCRHGPASSAAPCPTSSSRSTRPTTSSRRRARAGLAIAHELTERMGGTLDVDSRPGRTTFTFEIAATSSPLQGAHARAT